MNWWNDSKFDRGYIPLNGWLDLGFVYEIRAVL
jgi:hypothetical protein